MNILMISVLFAPNNEIGAIRPTKIAEYLANNGNNVDVVTYGGLQDRSFSIPSAINKVYSMMPYTERVNGTINNIETLHKNNLFVDSLKRHYRAFISESNGDKFVDYFVQLYKSTLQTNHYDVVITSFGPLACIKCGLYIKKRDPQIKWICDFRDPVVGGYTPLLLYGRWKSLQDKSCKMADKIVAVSDGYINAICGEKYKNKRYMIPNGYDESDISGIKTNNIKTPEKLTFVYAGSLYEGKRDVSVIFRAISQLASEAKISLDRICFKYAGNDFSTLKRQAAIYHGESILSDCGRLSRTDCLRLQLDSHFLVLATWNTKADKGIFPGKFLEYMLIRKPIVSITSGNLPDSEVSAVIKEGNFGIAYESAKDKLDFTILKNYIAWAYHSFISKGKVAFSPKQDVLEKYNYTNIMKQIGALL